MKKFAAKAVALAIGAAFGGVAFAGSISAPATDDDATVYAVEAVTNDTNVTLPAVEYTMGVSRTPAQDFTIIFKPTGGALFTAASCADALAGFAQGGTGTVVVSQKRSSTNECAYEVDVTADTDNTTTLSFTGFVLDKHSLGTAGSSASITVGLFDLGETARIDNNTDLTRKVATSVQAINIYAAAKDTGTRADVNADGGPLTGFITQNDDTATTARADLTFDNNSVGAVGADGVTPFDFTATAGTASLTLTGTNTGAAEDGLCIDLNNNATDCEDGEVFTLASGTSTIEFDSTAFPVQGTTETRSVSFLADGETSLGVSRSFAVSGEIDPEEGAKHALADEEGANGAWWVWDANASQLMTPYFTTNSLFLSRFFFLNTGSSAVQYDATCYSETGNAITYGAAKTGTLRADGQTAVNASSICTFSGNTRGAIVFTITAPINTVKGSYQAVDPVSLNNSVTPLTRPYNVNNVTE